MQIDELVPKVILRGNCRAIKGNLLRNNKLPLTMHASQPQFLAIILIMRDYLPKKGLQNVLPVSCGTKCTPQSLAMLGDEYIHDDVSNRPSPL